AVFLSTVYEGYFPDSKYKNYVWAGSLFTASLTGYLRYESGAHFPTDILVGAVVGSAVGYLIPYLHKSNSSVSDIYPSINNTNGITLHYVFQF
ncbi:MAG: phosphatase PAP2 family protein, partial [Ignavibacteria bacterium]|nr:phosphatase PAP2 family protein [Ignavibacteria bacterium]